MQLDTYVVIEYIKSSVDIILNLKFEEIEKRLMDKQDEGKHIQKKQRSRESAHPHRSGIESLQSLSNADKKNEDVTSS